jgi:capping protein (actin filament) muscle Z-line, alpha
MELDEERAKVLRYFFRNTPVGEHSEVLKDLERLLSPDLSQSEFVADFLCEHLAAHGTVIVHEGQSLQLTTIGRNGFQFFDPKHSATFDVNPFTLSVSNIATVSSGTSFSRLVQEKIDKYLAQHFGDTAQARVFQNDEGLFVFVACANVNLRNMWTGEWIGDWKVGEGTLQGTVSFNAHYFEEGNLQLTQKREFSRNFGGSEEETWAEEIVKGIKESDNQVQTAMDEIYDNMPSNVFRPMRRQMPVTGQKFADTYKTRMFS